MNLSPLTVLIVDDSPEDRLLVRRLLTRVAPTRYTLTEADRGARALAVVQLTPPDCILLDQGLPDQDGLTILAALRAFTDVPVLLFTGVGNEALAVHALQQGAQDYLVKGELTPERLHLTIQRAVATVQLTRERDQTRALLDALITSTPTGIGYMDAELRYRLVNPALAAINGQSPAAHLGRTPAELLPGLAPRLEPLMRQVLATGEAVRDLELHGRPCPIDGVTHDWLISYFPVALPTGGVAGVGVTVNDITASKRTEAALAASEQRLRFALRAAGMVAWEIDLSTTAITWSPEAEACFGLPAGALGTTAADVLALVHPDDRVALVASSERTRQSGVYSAEFRLSHANGPVVWVRAQGEVISDATGVPQRILGITQNISALKAAQETLRLSEERFRVALQDSPVVVFNQDRDLRYTWVYNPALGYTPDEVAGTTDYDLFERHEDAEAIVRLKRQVLTDGQGRRDEMWVWNQGQQLCYDLTVEPLRDGDGQVVGVTCAAVDISAQKQRELVLRQAREATAAALAKAEEATRERDLLISIAAHDLRTPLAVIHGQAQLLQRRAAPSGLDERALRSLAMITDQANRLNLMIQALLDLSRIQEGRLTIQREALDLGALLDRVVAMMRTTVSVHTLTLQSPTVPLILDADPLRIEQVFLNLLGNAIKYSPNGGLIAVWVEHDAAQVCIHIRDQGIGVPPEAQPRLFTRFYRAPNVPRQESSSLGVGLFIVRELVQAHGGTISVESTLGGGSTFTVALPRSRRAGEP